MTTNRHPTHRQQKKPSAHINTVSLVGVQIPIIQASWTAVPGCYQFQKDESGYGSRSRGTKQDDGKCQMGTGASRVGPTTNRHIGNAPKLIDLGHLIHRWTILRSPSTDECPVTGEDYHQFYDLLGDVFRTEAHLDVNNERLFNDFCRRLLAALAPLKWSSLVSLTNTQKPSQIAHRMLTLRSDAHNRRPITPVIGEKLPEKADIYDLSLPETPAGLRMLRDLVQEAAILPVRLDHQRALWILGSNQSGYLNRLGLKHLLMVPKMLELVASAKEQAHRDPLTGLPNRAYLKPRLAEAKARSIRQNTLFALGVLDLDDFKKVNDTLGHKAGDWILREMAKRLKKVLRSSDALIRLGGDEFIILLENINDCDGLDIILDRIKNVTNESYIYHDHKMQIDVSLGLTIYPFDNSPDDTLVHHADHALYAAKATKTTRRRFFTLYSELYGRSVS